MSVNRLPKRTEDISPVPPMKNVTTIYKTEFFIFRLVPHMKYVTKNYKTELFTFRLVPPMKYVTTIYQKELSIL